jgi:hypothetical protein
VGRSARRAVPSTSPPSVVVCQKHERRAGEEVAGGLGGMLVGKGLGAHRSWRLKGHRPGGRAIIALPDGRRCVRPQRPHPKPAALRAPWQVLVLLRALPGRSGWMGVGRGLGRQGAARRVVRERSRSRPRSRLNLARQPPRLLPALRPCAIARTRARVRACGPDLGGPPRL